MKFRSVSNLIHWPSLKITFGGRNLTKTLVFSFVKFFVIKKASPYIFLFLILIAAELFIHPVGEFPLNDDWSYSYSVKYWLEKDKIDLGYWPAMTLLAHVAWGKLVCQVFGFSQFVLRISTLILSLLSIFMAYKISLRMGKDKKSALLIALLLFLNPLFFLLSNTFMTDVPFLFSFLLCMLFAERYMDQRKWYWMLALIAACIYSLFIRQFAFAVPAALAAYSLVEFIKKNYAFGMSFWIPLMVCIPVFYWFCEWSAGFRPPNSSFVTSAKGIDPYMLFSKGLDRFTELFFTIGLFLFPFLLATFIRIAREIKLKDTLWMMVPFLVMLWAVSKGRFSFPNGNIFFASGLGPETLYDTLLLGINKNHVSSKAIEIAVYCLSRAGLLFLMINLSYYTIRFFQNGILKRPEYSFKLFILLLSACYFVLLTASESFFDRYLIPILAVASLFFVTWPEGKKVFKAIMVVYMVITGTFSLLATRDYFAWNKTRYALINEATKGGIPPQEINGGFEYLASQFYSSEWYAMWTSKESPYYICFGKIPGYEVAKYKPYKRSLTFEKDTLFLLKRVQPVK
jgi:hypothetical protein